MSIGALYPTFADVAKRLNPDGGIAEIAETMTKVNEFLDYLPWIEANAKEYHQVTSRNYLPTPTWRRYNQGVLPTKTGTEQFKEPIGMLEDYSKVDEAMAERYGGARYRKTEDDGKRQSFSLEVPRAFFYESITSNPDRVHGLTARFDYLSGNPAASQIVIGDPAASGTDCTSIWLLGFGNQKGVYGVYPQGAATGYQQRDMGLVLTEDGITTGAQFNAWVTHMKWYWGVVVHDWRYVVRGCNIDTSAWKADLSAGVDLLDLMDDMIAAFFEMNTVQPVFCMNRATFSMWNKQLKHRSTNVLEWVARGSKNVRGYQGIPILITDAITSTESVVS